jgi:hypothetical protein
MRHALAIVLAFGCGKNPLESSDNDKAGSGGAKAAAKTAAIRGTDWTAKKQVAQELTVEGVAFTIDIPEGLPRGDRDTVDWNDTSPGSEGLPKVFTSVMEVSRVPDLDKAKYFGTLDARAKQWVRAEQRPDGFALTTIEPDKSHVEVITYKQAGDQYIKCKALQTAEGALPKFDKTREMLEAICESVTPK